MNHNDMKISTNYSLYFCKQINIVHRIKTNLFDAFVYLNKIISEGIYY